MEPIIIKLAKEAYVKSFAQTPAKHRLVVKDLLDKGVEHVADERALPYVFVLDESSNPN